MTPLAYLAAFGGAFLVYAAINNLSPREALTSFLQGNASTGAPLATARGVGVGGDAGTTTPGPVAGPLDLVPIGYGSHRLTKSAAAGYRTASMLYGRTIPVTDSYRSSEQQAACYKAKPDLCAPPGKSKHEQGLAIDVDTSKVNPDDPALIKALTSAGWFRAGKVVRDGAGNMRPEPWHWSFGVKG